MFDLLIKGDHVVTPQGVGSFEVGVAGGKIMAVGRHGTFKAQDTRRLIDATGKVVMPGGIDPHVHCSWFMPFADGTSGLTDPPLVVSRAALFGGTTTLIDFARWTHGNTIEGALRQRDQE